jgi:alpha-beta hydrolase superfamily lysophospholipase
VLSSPLLGFAIRVPPLKKTFGRVCLTVAPRFRFRSKIPESFITRNSEALQIRASDPLSNRTVTAGWYFRVLDALCEAWQDAGRIEVPLLVMQGDADRVVSPDAPLGWITRVGSRDKSLRLLSGHLHELINEPGWQGTVTGVLDWLERRVPAMGVQSEQICVREPRDADEACLSSVPPSTSLVADLCTT